ncbi:MAG: glutathione-disulfide reductase [Rhodospirillaceae bacterium]|nr:glutathione-disulfide reductase [Rhodospirillaceae bacterium]
MTGYDFDFFVIGGGSGGVRAARIAAGHGARTGLAEARYLGGTCVNVGCVPKKLMVYASHFAQDFDDAGGFGWQVGPRTHDWPTLIANKDREIARLNGIYQRVLEGPGVTVFRQTATLLDPHTIALGDTRVTADTILIATGGQPTLPDDPGVKDHAICSDDVFHLPRRPERIIIVGGGYIAAEFAGVFHGLGTQVVQLYRRSLFLRGFDQDVRLALAEEMRTAGIDLRFNAIVTRLDRSADGITAQLRDAGSLTADCVLYATGRKPNTEGLGLDRVGVALSDSGAVRVDDDFRTSVPNIYAVGDVIHRIELTPVAIAEGHALADTLFANRPRGVSYDNVPSAVFSQPPVASVGLTEEEARRRFRTVDIYKTSFRPMRHTMTGREAKTFMKLVVDADSDRVVGCHMVGHDGPEIIQGLAIALNCGATKAQFDATIGLHPTTAEEFVTMRTKAPDPGEAARQAAE